MKIMVTGGAGFIGSHFVRYWLREHPEDEVVNFDKLTYVGNMENVKDVASHPRYTFVRGDICDPVAVRAAMEDADIVVHFAAESHVDRSVRDPAAFVMTNVVGTQVLLDAARKIGVQRFHHVSTDEVFGQLPLEGGELFNENTPYAPRSPYSASKAGADHLVRAYAATFQLPVTITNTSNNFGPYQYPEKLIPLAITNAIDGIPVPIYGDGKHVRDWLYVEDHCRAIDLVLQKGRVGETYCIGGMTEDISNIEIVRRILSLLGKEESLIDFVADRPGHDRRYAIDWSKARDGLGYAPERSFDAYLEETVRWYQDNEWWWRPLKQQANVFFHERGYKDEKKKNV